MVVDGRSRQVDRAANHFSQSQSHKSSTGISSHRRLQPARWSGVDWGVTGRRAGSTLGPTRHNSAPARHGSSMWTPTLYRASHQQLNHHEKWEGGLWHLARTSMVLFGLFWEPFKKDYFVVCMIGVRVGASNCGPATLHHEYNAITAKGKTAITETGKTSK